MRREPTQFTAMALAPEASRQTALSGARSWRHSLARLVALVRRLIGVPDYETYLAHMHRKYPGCTPLDPETFEQERLTARYRSAGTRCC